MTAEYWESNTLSSVLITSSIELGFVGMKGQLVKYHIYSPLRGATLFAHPIRHTIKWKTVGTTVVYLNINRVVERFQSFGMNYWALLISNDGRQPPRRFLNGFVVIVEAYLGFLNSMYIRHAYNDRGLENTRACKFCGDYAAFPWIRLNSSNARHVIGPITSVCMYVTAPIYSLRSYIQQVYLYSYRLTIKHLQRSRSFGLHLNETTVL